jgi:hypothetical protein
MTSDIVDFASLFTTSSLEFSQTFLSQVAAAAGSSLNKNAETEICAAVWAAIRTAFDTSIMAPDDRTEMISLVAMKMAPFWLEHCPPTHDIARLIQERSANYLLAPIGNVIGSAGAIVAGVVAAAGIPDSSRARATRTLTTVLAHRMFTDVRVIDEFSRRRQVVRRG